MVSYKDKIIIFPLFNTCYPQNLARNLASFFKQTIIDFSCFIQSQTLQIVFSDLSGGMFHHF